MGPSWVPGRFLLRKSTSLLETAGIRRLQDNPRGAWDRRAASQTSDETASLRHVFETQGVSRQQASTTAPPSQGALIVNTAQGGGRRPLVSAAEGRSCRRPKAARFGGRTPLVAAADGRSCRWPQAMRRELRRRSHRRLLLSFSTQLRLSFSQQLHLSTGQAVFRTCTFGAEKLQAKQVSAPEDCGV